MRLYQKKIRGNKLEENYHVLLILHAHAKEKQQANVPSI